MQEIQHSFSRTKIELFHQCPKCFYLDTKLGVSHPPSFPFSINNAVDALLKKEFDYYRRKQEVHHIVKSQGINLIPFNHDMMDAWRSNKKGIRAQYKGYKFWGAIDDLWTDDMGRIYVVDYKATAGQHPVDALDKAHHPAYKRQIELYQWMFKTAGFDVADTAYFYYCTGNSSAPYFNGKVEFTTHVLAHKGNHDWIEPLLDQLISIYESNTLPESSSDCKYCSYTDKRIKNEQTN